MTEEPDDATPRVVKKVVKKTVVRPIPQRASQPASATPASRPASARLTTPARAQTTRPAVPQMPPPSVPPVAEPSMSAPPPTTPPPPKAVTTIASPRKRISIPKLRVPSVKKPSLPSLPHPDVRGRVAKVRHGISDRFHDGMDAVRFRIADGWDWLISLRLPHVSPMRGSVITGAFVGLISVGFGWAFYQLFSAVRGTQAGGGWGFLALVFVAFIAFIVGELMLSGFGVPHSRPISFLSIMLVLLLVLIFFIRLAAGIWAWLLIPTLTATSFVTACVLMGIASQQENLQRLPWEPTDESQVNRD